jgi:hypothetical protein
LTSLPEGAQPAYPPSRYCTEAYAKKGGGGEYYIYSSFCSLENIGADVNAVIERRVRITNAHVPGPNRNTCVNDRGELLLNLMIKWTLVDTLSFHKHKLYDTWVSNLDNTSYAHDHISQKIKINDVRVTRVGVQSDHLVIELRI